MGEERRQEKRIRENFGLICKVFSKTELEADLSKIVDFSQKGLCFIGDDQIGQEDILQLMFRVPPDFKKKVEIFGRVVRTQDIGDRKFKISVAFIDFPEETKTILKNSIQQAGFKDSA
ncbi:MAG: PilZ domain-containing protein [Candidatus Omnitrophota bacterium]